MKYGIEVNVQKNHITKLQSGCRGQAAPPFKQLLCGRPHWGARKEKYDKKRI